jgi:coiled-coil domain-containing protein 12
MEDRKARLAALAARAGRVITQPEAQHFGNTDKQEEEIVTDQTHVTSQKRNIQFRNYLPSDPKLGDQLPTASIDDESKASNKRFRSSVPVVGIGQAQQDQQKKSVLELALEKARSEVSSSNGNAGRPNDLPIQSNSHAPVHNNNNNSTALSGTKAPKKINADLKRNIQSKLDRLHKRTQKAIVSLLRERLELEATVSTSSNTNQDDVD